MSLRQIAADVLAASVFTGLAASAQVSIDDLRSASGGHVLEIGYFVASGSAANGFRASDRELAMWALQTWQRTIGPAVRFAPRSEAEALIRVYWARPVDGQYGEMRPLVVGDRHGAATYIRPDTDSLGDQIGPRAAADARASG